MSVFCYYRGLYKVKVLTKSEGYLIIEALENLEDYVDHKKVTVKPGEKSIVLPSDLYKKKTRLPLIPKHMHKRLLEKKVKRIVEE